MLEEVEQRNLGLIVVTHNKHLAKRVCTRMIHLEEINHIRLTEKEAAEGVS